MGLDVRSLDARPIPAGPCRRRRVRRSPKLNQPPPSNEPSVAAGLGNKQAGSARAHPSLTTNHDLDSCQPSLDPGSRVRSLSRSAICLSPLARPMNVSDAASYLSASSSASSSGLPTSSAVVDNSLFPFLPRWLKLAVVVLFVLNARSWPGVWHAGVWYHAVRAQVRAHVFTGVLPHLRDMLASNGADPFKLKSVRSLWAGPDDCDCACSTGLVVLDELELTCLLSLALSQLAPGASSELAFPAAAEARADRPARPPPLSQSNSCYAKHCDASRMKAIVDWFGPFLVAGGWCGLAGTLPPLPCCSSALVDRRC